MRALAVGLVLAYHFWPHRVQGGFVGVDVFFVISGFLITSHLVNKPPKRFMDVVEFWGRRVRRLLPVAFLVIIVATAAMVFLVPRTQRDPNGLSGIMAALYVENWHLAARSVDYLAIGSPPTVLQHYWSLSVEEQFYLVWPILIAAIALITGRRFRRGVGIGIAAVVLTSFTWSVYYTAVYPPKAYFVTTTRMWELGLGGLLAVVYPWLATRLSKHPWIKLGLVAAGLSMMIWSGFFVTGENFPGWIAAIPVLGAVLVIGGGPGEHSISFDTVLRWKPVQLIGDWSYSIYLWHWPFVVLTPHAVGREMTWPIKLAAIALTLVLSACTKTFIEDKFRGLHPLGVPLRRTFIFLVVGMALAVAPGAVVTYVLGNTKLPTIPASETCVGAAMTLDPACEGRDPHGETLYFTPTQTIKDLSITYKTDCRWTVDYPTHYPVCEFGAKNADAPSVALWGNSHAIPYLDPLIVLADQNNWKLSSHLAGACYPATMELVGSDRTRPGCLGWTNYTIDELTNRDVDLIVMVSRTLQTSLVGVPEQDQAEVHRQMFVDILDDLTSRGFHVLVIRHAPVLHERAPDCVSSHESDYSACDYPRDSVVYEDHLYEAAVNSTSPAITAVDLNDAMCDESTCRSVVGGLLWTWDDQHMTKTFALSLAPFLEPIISEALEASLADR
jgi:peptidoglycan/LPS O-acetylase OafA/YrhL